MSWISEYRKLRKMQRIPDIDPKQLEEQEILVRVLNRLYRERRGLRGPKVKTIENLVKRAKRKTPPI